MSDQTTYSSTRMDR